MRTHRHLIRANVPASGVGVGIANAIFAVAEKIGGPEDAVFFCVTAAEEAFESVLHDPPARVGREGRNVNAAEKLLRELSGKVYSDEAERAELLAGDELLVAAKVAAAMAFRCCMPQLVNRQSVQCFIACVAAGMLHGYILGKEANALLFAAQGALSAMPKPRARRARK